MVVVVATIHTYFPSTEDEKKHNPLPGRRSLSPERLSPRALAPLGRRTLGGQALPILVLKEGEPGIGYVFWWQNLPSLCIGRRRRG